MHASADCDCTFLVNEDSAAKFPRWGARFGPQQEIPTGPASKFLLVWPNGARAVAAAEAAAEAGAEAAARLVWASRCMSMLCLFISPRSAWDVLPGGCRDQFGDVTCSARVPSKNL